MIINAANTGTFIEDRFILEWSSFFGFINYGQEIGMSFFRQFKKAPRFKTLRFLVLKYRGTKNCFFLRIVKNSFSLAQHFERSDCLVSIPFLLKWNFNSLL